MSPLSLTFRAYGPPSGLTLIQQYFKHITALCCCEQPCILFLKAHFPFFARSMGGVVADRELQSFKPTDS